MLSNTAQSNAKGQILVKPHYELVKFTDGDDLIVKNIFSHKEENIRLLGIDAPETQRTNKLKQDEKELHLAAKLLLELGFTTLRYVNKNFKIGSKISLLIEADNPIDKYGRTLAYVQLESGRTINEILIADGFAKPYNKVYCNELPKYQELNLIAKQKKVGLYKLVNYF